MAGQIFIEAADVEAAGLPLGAKHLYLVFRDTNGEEYVLRSGPQSSYLPWFGQMKIEANVPMEDSVDNREGDTPEERSSTPLDFPGLTDDQAWAIMVKYARMIDAADYPYEVLDENSNAFIGALLAAAGGDPASLLPEGISQSEAVGLSNYRDILADVPPPSDGVVRGTTGNDQITGIQIDEVIRAGAGNDQVRTERGFDQVYGEAGDDRLFGGAGNDSVYAGSGSDVLVGESGRDHLYGGTDSLKDVFVFTARSHSTVGSGHDVIHNFTSRSDLIDLRGIDAKSSTTSTNEAFTWGNHTAGAHKVWWSATTGGVLLKADTTGNTTVDFEVLLQGATSLGSGDVLL
jgi:hypothetical protein